MNLIESHNENPTGGVPLGFNVLDFVLGEGNAYCIQMG